MRVTNQGRITIPARIRERFGFLPGVEVEFIEVDGCVRLQTVELQVRVPGDQVVARLRGRATVPVTRP